MIARDSARCGSGGPAGVGLFASLFRSLFRTTAPLTLGQIGDALAAAVPPLVQGKDGDAGFGLALARAELCCRLPGCRTEDVRPGADWRGLEARDARWRPPSLWEAWRNRLGFGRRPQEGSPGRGNPVRGTRRVVFLLVADEAGRVRGEKGDNRAGTHISGRERTDAGNSGTRRPAARARVARVYIDGRLAYRESGPGAGARRAPDSCAHNAPQS